MRTVNFVTNPGDTFTSPFDMGSSSSSSPFSCSSGTASKLFFGETDGPLLPREYQDADLLLQTEHINGSAVIRQLWVFSGNLQKKRLPLSFDAATHWWVVILDSEKNFWTAESVGEILVQRVNSINDAILKRKDVGDSQAKDRSRDGIGIIPLIETEVMEGKTMKDFADWLMDRRSHPYHALFDNCQRFSDALCRSLSGKEVPKLTTAGALLHMFCGTDTPPTRVIR
jgi:hypothetical protein